MAATGNCMVILESVGSDGQTLNSFQMQGPSILGCQLASMAAIGNGLAIFEVILEDRGNNIWHRKVYDSAFPLGIEVYAQLLFDGKKILLVCGFEFSVEHGDISTT